MVQIDRDNDYLRTSETEDVLYSLHHCNKCLEDISDNIQNWKWVIISTHMALQGAYVCHLTGTRQLGALSDRNAEEWLTWYYDKDEKDEKINKAPDRYLANFIDLHKRLKKNIVGAGQTISYSKNQDKAVKLLHNLRKQFAHFAPQGWSIELLGLPDIILKCMEIIELIKEDEWPFRHMKNDRRDELSLCIHQIKTKCNQLHIDYNERWNR